MFTRDQVFAIMQSDSTAELDSFFESDPTPGDRAQVLAWIEEYIQPSSTPLSEDLIPDDVPVDTRELEARIRAAPGPVISDKTMQNRQRAARGNMLKKLKKVYAVYTMFNAADAARVTKTSVYDMAAYLANEAKMPGTQIEYDEERNAYYIKTMFG